MPQDQLDAMVNAGKGTTSSQPDWLQAMVSAGNNPSQSAALLGHATGVMQQNFSSQNSFYSPLQNIQQGNNDNLQHAIGAGKQAIQDFTSAGAQNAGLVGQQMMQDALNRGGGAAKFAGAIQGAQTALQPTNMAQQQGANETSMGEILLPTPAIANAPEVKGIANTLAEKSGLTKFLQDRAEAKAMTNSVKALSPKMTSGEIEAAQNVVRPSRGAPFVDHSQDKNFMEMAADAKGIVSGKSAIDDKNALKAAIQNTSENQIKPLLAQNKVPANFEDLQKKLSLVHPQSSLKADPSAAKTYNRVREEIQSSLYDSLKQTAKEKGDFTGNVDFNDVWDARKILDAKAEEELGPKTFGTPEYTGAKAAVQDMRQALTQYIKDSIQFPGQMENVNRMQEFVQVARSKGIDIGSTEGKALMEQMGIKPSAEGAATAKQFEDSMRKVSNYYKAIDNVSTKVPDEIRANNTFGKRHPILKKIGQGLGIGGGIGIEEEVRKHL